MLSCLEDKNLPLPLGERIQSRSALYKLGNAGCRRSAVRGGPYESIPLAKGPPSASPLPLPPAGEGVYICHYHGLRIAKWSCEISYKMNPKPCPMYYYGGLPTQGAGAKGRPR